MQPNKVIIKSQTVAGTFLFSALGFIFFPQPTPHPLYTAIVLHYPLCHVIKNIWRGVFQHWETSLLILLLLLLLLLLQGPSGVVFVTVTWIFHNELVEMCFLPFSFAMFPHRFEVDFRSFDKWTNNVSLILNENNVF